MELDTFSRTVKEELARVPVDGHSAAYWEATALHRFLPARSKDADGTFTAEPFVLRRLFYLMKQGSGVRPTVIGSSLRGKRQARGKIPPPAQGDSAEPSLDAIRSNPDCRRAFLRGVFLARGSVSSPIRTHHLEMALPAKKDALFVRSLLSKEGLGAGLVLRRSNWVVYLKDGDDITVFLTAVGANKSVLDYENVRAQKSLKSSVQRLVNMDRANVSRSVEASLKQLRDIRLIDEERGLATLPLALRELARLRMENPDMSMEELGQALSVPASKSAVNHRFRRLAEIAEEIRNGRLS
ncbi:MAG: DNA-binding protein WhiA [Bacillota bacterium]